MSDQQRHAPLLTPPGQEAAPAADATGSYRLLWIALAAVLLVGLAVIIALPRLINQPAQVSTPAETTTPPTAASSAAANQAMSAYLKLRAQLELRNAGRWGEPAWSQAEQAAAEGSRLLAQRQFSTAAGRYEQAQQLLETLGGGRESRLSAALAAGRQALASNNLEEAGRQYELALAIDANNQDATFGLARTRARPMLLDNMAIGDRAEQAGDLLAAQAAYQEAALMDPEYEPPATAFSRVSAVLEAAAFQEAMTRTLTALEKGQFNEAQKALATAAKLHPTDPAVADVRQRLYQARQVSRLNTLRRRAEAQVKSENWPAARSAYKAALAIDVTAGFARSGLEQAESRMKLNRQFDHYLRNPERLYAEQPLENARTLLAAVGNVPASEPKLAKKVARLQQRVEEAGTPVPVTLTSDGLTDISIYHVGQLGAFTNWQLELLPGSYTVVGSCPGYRDVRKQLQVKPGRQPVSLAIRCEEMI